MEQIRSVNCGDQYTTAATLEGIVESSGGYFVVENNQALVQLQYGALGSFQFQTGEAQVPLGNGILQTGTCGIRFRNAVAGSVAVVTAAIYENVEPALIVTAGGLSTPSTNPTLLTGIVDSAGTILGGTGFTVVHTGTGVYQINFDTPFSAPPVGLVTLRGLGFFQCVTTSPQMTVTMTNTSAAPTDMGFQFEAQAIQ